MEDAIPYKNGSLMYLVEDIDDQEILRDIILDTCKGLKEKQK